MYAMLCGYVSVFTSGDGLDKNEDDKDNLYQFNSTPFDLMNACVYATVSGCSFPHEAETRNDEMTKTRP